MIVKANFKAVADVRSFTTREGATKYTVTYLINAPYSRRDGSVGSNQFLVEVVYDQQPNVTVGELNDSNQYEFELYFRVNAGRNGGQFQHITCSKVTQVVL